MEGPIQKYRLRYGALVMHGCIIIHDWASFKAATEQIVVNVAQTLYAKQSDGVLVLGSCALWLSLSLTDRTCHLAVVYAKSTEQLEL